MMYWNPSEGIKSGAIIIAPMDGAGRPSLSNGMSWMNFMPSAVGFGSFGMGWGRRR